MLSLLLLAGCEQAVLLGPVGGGEVRVTELRSGNVISEGAIFTDDVNASMQRWGEAFDTFTAPQLRLFLGIAILNTLNVDEDSWYLVTVSGGLDYNGYPDLQPTPVDGPIHAIMSGEQLNRGGFVLGSLSEAAYQWVRPWLTTLDDEELGDALREYSRQLVVDNRAQEITDYDDLLAYNPLAPLVAYIGPTDRLEAMREALASGASDADKLAIAEEAGSTAAPRVAAERLYEAEISPSVTTPICGRCHVAGSPTGAGSTRHVLESSAVPDYIAINVAMYSELVGALGVQGVLNKAQGINHRGGRQLGPPGAQFDNFEAFLNLL